MYKKKTIQLQKYIFTKNARKGIPYKEGGFPYGRKSGDGDP